MGSEQQGVAHSTLIAGNFSVQALDATSEASHAIDRIGVTTLCNAAFLYIRGLSRSEEIADSNT